MLANAGTTGRGRGGTGEREAGSGDPDQVEQARATIQANLDETIRLSILHDSKLAEERGEMRKRQQEERRLRVLRNMETRREGLEIKGEGKGDERGWRGKERAKERAKARAKERGCGWRRREEEVECGSPLEVLAGMAV